MVCVLDAVVAFSCFQDVYTDIFFRKGSVVQVRCRLVFRQLAPGISDAAAEGEENSCNNGECGSQPDSGPFATM